MAIHQPWSQDPALKARETLEFNVEPAMSRRSGFVIRIVQAARLGATPALFNEKSGASACTPTSELQGWVSCSNLGPGEVLPLAAPSSQTKVHRVQLAQALQGSEET